MSATECCHIPTALDTTPPSPPLHSMSRPSPHRQHYRHCRHPQVVSQRQERSVMRAKPRRAATRRSMMPTVLGRTRKSGTHRRVWRGVMTRGECIWWLFLKRGSRACGSNISRGGDGKGVTLVKYLGAPPPHPGSPACCGSVGFLPGDLSVTLSRCIAIQGLWRVPQPDHEIGQLSCLPHPSTSSRSGDGTV